MAGVAETYEDTVTLGAVGMMCREWGGALKYTEQVQYNRVMRTTGVFETYVTEGDGIREAAQQGCTVFDISGANAGKQAAQLAELTQEVMSKT